jgi:N-acetylglucosaminyldiphosphoundecaprenol N-acetyl-beta-D-mannosaminyltransferase
MIALEKQKDSSTGSDQIPETPDRNGSDAPPVQEPASVSADTPPALTALEREHLLDSLDYRFQPQRIRKQRIRVRLSLLLLHVTMSLQARTKRLFDVWLAFALLLLFSPVAVFLVLVGRLRRTTKLGLWCEPYTEYSFELSQNWLGNLLGSLGIKRLPALVNIIKGDMSFVGPRSATLEELTPRERSVRKRSEVRPGLICLWWIRRRSNINYQSELDTDMEYVENNTMGGDLGIVLRGLPALLYGEQCVTTARNLTVLDIPVNNMTMGEVLDELHVRMEGGAPTRVAFVNADCVNLTYRNSDYLNTLQTADLVLADGIGMKLAGKLLGQEIRQNVNGTDLFPRLCESLQGTGKGIYLLGARPGIADAVRSWVEANYPGVIISGAHSGYFPESETEAVIQEIANSGASILLVAMGAPRQDQWVHKHLEACGVAVGMGVGGLFDFYSGQTSRAPLWVREMGLEWLYRMVQEPGRLWKRYLVGNIVFLSRVLCARVLRTKRTPNGMKPDAGRAHSAR